MKGREVSSEIYATSYEEEITAGHIFGSFLEIVKYFCYIPSHCSHSPKLAKPCGSVKGPDEKHRHESQGRGLVWTSCPVPLSAHTNSAYGTRSDSFKRASPVSRVPHLPIQRHLQAGSQSLTLSSTR